MTDDALYVSNRLGRWSFAQTIPTGSSLTGQTLPLLTVQGVEAAEARPWTVNLNAWRYGAGNLGAGVPQNFTADNLLYSLSQLYAVVEFGVDGANERCELDWNPSGLSFSVNAAFVRIGVRWLFDFLQAAPNLSGYITPGARQSNLICSPRFTDTRSLPNGTATRVFRPSRAVAYRMSFRENAAGGETYTLEQQAASGAGAWTTCKQDGVHSRNNVGNPDMVPDAAAGYFPVVNETQALLITTSAAGSGTAHIEWLLDLG